MTTKDVVTIQIAPQLRERVQRHVESGRYVDASAVIERALDLMEENQEKLRVLWELIQEGLDEVERGETVVMTPTFWDELQAEADEEDRLGIPIPDHVKP